MIEIKDVNPVRKGCLLATCNVRLDPWKWTFFGVKIFEKGQNRWIALPSSEMTKQDGSKAYKEMGAFDSAAILKRFGEQIMAEFDKYLEKNPEMTPDDVIKPGDDLPF